MGLRHARFTCGSSAIKKLTWFDRMIKQLLLLNSLLQNIVICQCHEDQLFAEAE